MLLLIAVLAVVAAAVLLVLFVKRQDRTLIEDAPDKYISAEHFRPLFAPSDEELRALEREEGERRVASRQNELERKRVEKERAIDAKRATWRSAPNRHNTIELLRLAAENGAALAYSESADEVIEVFRTTGLDGLSSNDLADLLDSHYRLLPQEERSSGIAFRLRGEIAELRSKSDKQ